MQTKTEFLAQIKPGDIIAVEGKGLLSETIKDMDSGEGYSSQYSHVGIAAKLASSPESVPVIIEATGSGVEINDLINYDADKLSIYRYKHPYNAIKIVDCASKLRGSPYDFDQIKKIAVDKIINVFGFNHGDHGFDQDKSLICSQLVYLAYQADGINLKSNQNGIATPNSICADSNLTKIAEWVNE